MSDFLISARKYRPTEFSDVVDQESVTEVLNSAISNGKLSQALLFTGPRGVGKTSCARIVARKINNFEINDENSYNIFELDAASNNGVDAIRNLIEQTRIPPQFGKYKVYIIDEVHMLSSGAFNAFLKTLEEPPKHCIFILATTEKHKIIPTILSRCQVYSFKRISIDGIVNHLKNICKKENIDFDEPFLTEIANKSEGAMRDALQLFDKISGGNKAMKIENISTLLNTVDFNTYLEIHNHILSIDIRNIILKSNEILNSGISGNIFISGLCDFYRDLLVHMEVGDNSISKNIFKEKYNELSKSIDTKNVIEFMKILNESEINFEKSINKRLMIEITLLKLASLNNDSKKKINLVSISNFSKNEFNKTLKEKPKDYVLEKPIANIDSSNFITSTLSLNSLEKNKKLVEKNINSAVFETNNNILFDDFIKKWNSYTDSQEKNGRFNISSILRMSEPILKKNNIIEYEIPNNTASIELLKEREELINYLNKNLNGNFQLKVLINKKLEKKTPISNSDKYLFMNKKNSNLETLKIKFDLKI